MADDPMDVAARVLALQGPYLGGQDIYPSDCYTEASFRADAVTLAREVVRSNEALHEATIEKGKAVAQWGIAMSEVARLNVELRWIRQALEAAAGHSSPMLAAGLRAIAAGPP